MADTVSVMAKSKKKARPMADKVRARRQKGATHSTTTDNPFEVKINHQKHVVLGRKLTKFDKGRPGVSRTKAINKVSVESLNLKS